MILSAYTDGYVRPALCLSYRQLNMRKLCGAWTW
jgi:hypothetical protein